MAITEWVRDNKIYPAIPKAKYCELCHWERSKCKCKRGKHGNK